MTRNGAMAAVYNALWVSEAASRPRTSRRGGSPVSSTRSQVSSLRSWATRRWVAEAWTTIKANDHDQARSANSQRPLVRSGSVLAAALVAAMSANAVDHKRSRLKTAMNTFERRSWRTQRTSIGSRRSESAVNLASRWRSTPRC